MRVVDLFCGCGGLSLGLQNAGLDVVRAYDSWKPAVDVYNANFEHECKLWDIADIEATVADISPLDIDLIAGGPPCQDFSHAGKRLEGDRASLTGAFAEIIARLSPRYFLMENVDRAQKSMAYRSAKDVFESAGYELCEVVIDASLCGAPQRRKRFFCIGSRAGDIQSIKEYLLSNLAERPMTVREYLGEEFGIEYYYRHPRNYNRRGIFSIDEAAPTVRGVNRPVPKGYKGHHGDAGPINRDLRPLTTVERARLQTFPRKFIWTGGRTNLEQMIGNAVPVALGAYVGRGIMQAVKEFPETPAPRHKSKETACLS